MLRAAGTAARDAASRAGLRRDRGPARLPTFVTHPPRTAPPAEQLALRVPLTSRLLDTTPGQQLPVGLNYMLTYLGEGVGGWVHGRAGGRNATPRRAGGPEHLPLDPCPPPPSYPTHPPQMTTC